LILNTTARGKCPRKTGMNLSVIKERTVKRRLEKPNVYEVTVTRDRVVRETRTVQVIAYTADAAKMLAKQKRPKEGWELCSLDQGRNSAATTTFGPSEVKLVGVANDLPEDSAQRHEILNLSSFVVRLKGEY
jgi:hypothetical protein